jgi:hypothetical protein
LDDRLNGYAVAVCLHSRAKAAYPPTNRQPNVPSPRSVVFSGLMVKALTGGKKLAILYQMISMQTKL